MKGEKKTFSKITGLSQKPFAGRPFLLLLFIFLEIFIVVYFISDYRKNDNLYREQLFRAFDAGYRGATNSYDHAVQMIFSNDVNKPEVLRLVALALDDDRNRDTYRNELYRLMLPFYERQKTIGILQVHFHLKDGTGFLRMHAPEKYGDNLFRRVGVYQVNKEQKPVKGYEVGYFADGYRFMYPLIFKGRHVGSIEFGITAEGIINQLNKIYPANYLFMINRTIVDDMTYEDWKKRNYRESDLSDDFMIGQKAAVDATVFSINQKLKNKVRDRLDGMEQFVEKIAAAGKNYMITFLPIEDVKGDPAAYFIQYRADDFSEHYLRTTIVDITLFTFFLAAIFYTFDNIQSRGKHLELKNIELENISNELQQYKLLSQHARDIILFIDMDGSIIEANEAAEKAYGYTREEFSGLSITDLRSSDTQHSIEEQIKLVNEGGLLFETVHRRRDGSIFPVEVSSIGVDIGDRRVLLSIIRDITERKKIQEAVVKSEYLLRTIIENEPACVKLLAKDGSLLMMNTAGLNMIQADSFDQVKNQCVYSMVLPAYREAFRNITENAFKGESGKLEFEAVGLKGGTVWLDTHAVPLFNEDGEIFAMLGITRDVTERKHRDEALRVSLEKYRVLFESFPLGVSITDKDGRIIETNSQAELLLGVPKEDHVNRSYSSPDWRIIRPDGTTMPVEEFAAARALREQRLIENIEMGIVRDTGDIVWLSVTAAPIPLESYGVAITYGDITERKKVEDRIKRSLREKEILLREIHHRVKNNMQVITSLLNLQARRIEDPNLRKPFEESEQRIKAMALVHERLYQKEDLSGINFSEYINKLVRELKFLYRVDESRIVTKIDVADVVLDIDTAIPCGLILNELVTNCFKYAFPENRRGKVFVGFSKVGNTYSLKIKDNGVGLPEGLDYRQTATLGMQLVNVLTKQLLGTLNIRSEEGTEAVITFTEREQVYGEEEDTDS